MITNFLFMKCSGRPKARKKKPNTEGSVLHTELNPTACKSKNMLFLFFFERTTYLIFWLLVTVTSIPSKSNFSYKSLKNFIRKYLKKFLKTLRFFFPEDKVPTTEILFQFSLLPIDYAYSEEEFQWYFFLSPLHFYIIVD